MESLINNIAVLVILFTVFLILFILSETFFLFLIIVSVFIWLDKLYKYLKHLGRLYNGMLEWYMWINKTADIRRR